ncbi:MAG TPA: hypothetical protein DDY82_01140, partial [Clostridiales bacterium]|nr:hypothetical protein [Clostridiales bacterium]
CDPLLVRQMLSQLSYAPIKKQPHFDCFYTITNYMQNCKCFLAFFLNFFIFLKSPKNLCFFNVFAFFALI